MWKLGAELGLRTNVFTGTLLTEDYFKGDAGYSYYQRGKIVLNREQANLIKRATFEKSSTLASEKYDLDNNNNNCVHYATNVFNAVNPPTGLIGSSGFVTPDDLNTHLRIIKALNPDQKGIETNRVKPLNSTKCN